MEKKRPLSPYLAKLVVFSFVGAAAGLYLFQTTKAAIIGIVLGLLIAWLIK